MSAGRERLAVALDVDDPGRAEELARRLVPFAGTLKVGPAHALLEGAPFVRRIKALGARVFLDVKLYDIPNTVRRICRAASGLGVDYLTVHAAGGSRMIAAGVEGAGEGGGGTELIAVTVLTSFTREDLEREWRLGETVAERAAFWARMAVNAGARGVVCSAAELPSIRSAAPGAFTVVPGIRSAADDRGDQRRAAGAGEAAAAGADLLVVGRPIVESPDPEGAARRIAGEIEAALG